MQHTKTFACILVMASRYWSILILVFVTATLVAAQTNPGAALLRGTVCDGTGAVLPGAHIAIIAQDGREIATRTSDAVGTFTFSGLEPASYKLVVTKEGFRQVTQTVKAGPVSHGTVRIVLPIAAVAENVTVLGSDSSAQISADIAQNQSGNAVDSDALDRLPVFDQDYITAMSRFLDADATGTNGVTLVVNGVEANGPGVTASAIQSVKINQNPYTALYSRPGRARIEITTKGGTTHLHGSANFLYRDALFDAANPFAVTKPAEQRTYLEGSLTGPLSRGRKTTFLLALDKDNDNQEGIVHAAGPQGVINANVPNPTHHYFLSGRVFHDYAQGDQFWMGYSFEHRTVANQGVGGTVLPQAGTNTLFFEHEVNLGHVDVVSARLLNQLHFLVGHYDNQVHDLNENPLLLVSGAFTGGGAQADSRRTEYHFDGTDIMTYTAGRQEVKFGVDVPDISRRGFDDFTNEIGSYSFASLADYTLAQPFTFVLQSGQGHVAFLEKTVAGIFEDNVRFTPNFSASLGVRYYWQNYFHDIAHNFAPRLSFAWAPSAQSRTVLRGGGGFFFDRSGPAPIADLLHFNGVLLRRFIVGNPSFPITGAELAAVRSSVVSLDPRQRIPYTIQYGIGIEEQLNARSSVFLNYLGTRGIDQFRSIDRNAPPPPAYTTRPNPDLGQQRLMQSEGYLKSNGLEVGFRGQPVKFFTGQARYNLGKTENNAMGITYFPANSYFPGEDWGRSDNDQRHRLDMLGTLQAEKWFSLGTALSAYSGKPVNITTGNDDYHDGLSNARPPAVPRNSLHGPGYLDFDLNLAHRFTLTRRREKGPTATVGISSFNVLNHVNDVTYIGVRGSPFFGQAVAAQPARRMQFDVEMRF